MGRRSFSPNPHILARSGCWRTTNLKSVCVPGGMIRVGFLGGPRNGAGGRTPGRSGGGRTPWPNSPEGNGIMGGRCGNPGRGDANGGYRCGGSGGAGGGGMEGGGEGNLNGEGGGR